jgi:hypothetical protein
MPLLERNQHPESSRPTTQASLMIKRPALQLYSLPTLKRAGTMFNDLVLPTTATAALQATEGCMQCGVIFPLSVPSLAFTFFLALLEPRNSRLQTFDKYNKLTRVLFLFPHGSFRDALLGKAWVSIVDCTTTTNTGLSEPFSSNPTTISLFGVLYSSTHPLANLSSSKPRGLLENALSSSP